MNKDETPNRITMLWEDIKQERPESQPFDYSPESLIPLWDWYETKIKQVPKTKKEMEYEVSRYPKRMEENVRKITMKYTDETLSLALSEKPDKNRLYDLYRNCEDEFDPIKPSYWDSW